MAVQQPHYSSEEIAQRGKELYQQHFRTQVETADNIDKIIAIDLNTGNYEIAMMLFTRLVAHQLGQQSDQRDSCGSGAYGYHLAQLRRCAV